MAKISTHCSDCKKVLGNEYKDIHEFLDQYAKKYNPAYYSEYHRQFLHNSKTVKEIFKSKGHYAAQAAKLHIIRDNQLYVYFNIDKIREDDIEELYQKALKFCHENFRDE